MCANVRSPLRTTHGYRSMSETLSSATPRKHARVRARRHRRRQHQTRQTELSAGATRASE
jgi:hypothetical protein